jgi:hypothetical protein
MCQQGSVEQHSKMLRSWQLAILRFAVTQDNADRLGVLAVANQIDRLGRLHEDETDFGFFRKTSSELCAAILQRDETADVILRQYLARIDDLRLKRAFAAALEIEHGDPASDKRRFKPAADLWRGLTSPGNIPALSPRAVAPEAPQHKPAGFRLAPSVDPALRNRNKRGR